ncbi:MAG TPA: PilZ domain-containing protein [Pyrinomonadaceae bacterium]|jgi:hypothetical protein
MKQDGKSRRVRERLELQLPVRVHCRESLDHEWVEVSRLLDITPFGTRFTISRPTEKGRILHLTMPLPRQLRCFDHVEDQYRVWALVRHVSARLPVQGRTGIRFDVGVAFIGKRAPASFELDPTIRYEVAASATDAGLWIPLEQQQEELKEYTPSNDRRPETRHSIPVNVTIEVFNEKGEVSESEHTVTENLSRRGAAVFTTLNVAGGRFVRVTSTQYGASIMAAVRANRKGPDGIPRLHLEFIGQQWPLEGIE